MEEVVCEVFASVGMTTMMTRTGVGGMVLQLPM